MNSDLLPDVWAPLTHSNCISAIVPEDEECGLADEEFLQEALIDSLIAVVLSLYQLDGDVVESLYLFLELLFDGWPTHLPRDIVFGGRPHVHKVGLFELSMHVPEGLEHTFTGKGTIIADKWPIEQILHPEYI